MKLLITFALLTIYFTAGGQAFQGKKRFPSGETSFAKKDKQPLTFYPGTYIDTEDIYTDSTGITVIIQNSLPRGGNYTDPGGRSFGYRIFWTRVVNEAASPLELTLKFPADSFPGLSSSDSYVKLLLPSDTMMLEKETSHDYGVIGLKSFLDASLNKPTMVQRAINPKEACMFYIVALFHQVSGAVRAEIVLKEQDLFYRIKGITPPLDVAFNSFGKIVLKK